MQQKAFGGRALPGSTGGAYALPQTPLAAVRGPTCKGKGREKREREGRGRKGEWKEKGKGVLGATIFHLHPCSRPPSGGAGALPPAGGLAPHPQLLPPYL